MIDEAKHKRTIKRAAKHLRATPTMDAVDTKQQEEIDTLKEIDLKHDAQFFGVGFCLVLMLFWNIAITISLWK